MSLSGLTYASSSMQAYQEALYVTGENLANQSATGYTRQVYTPSVAPCSPIKVLPVAANGTGSSLYSANNIERVRDQFLDGLIRSQNATVSNAQTANTVYSKLNTAFDETSTSGLNADISTFMSDVQSVANAPGDLSMRQTLLTDAQSLASTFNQQAGAIQSQRTSAEQQADQSLANANQILQQLAQLNGPVAQGTTAGNALLDQRDELLDNLSQLMDIQVTTQPQGDILVYQGNVPLLYGNTARTLSVTPTSGAAGESAGAALNVSQANAGAAFGASTGTLTIQGNLVGGNPVTVNVAAGDSEDTVINNINTALTTAGVTGVTAADNGGSISITANKLSAGTLASDLQVTAAGTGATVAGFAASAAGTATGPVAVGAGATATLTQNETLSFADGNGHNTSITVLAGQTVGATVNSIQTALTNFNVPMTASFNAATNRINLENVATGSATHVACTVSSDLSSTTFGGLQIVSTANTNAVVASGKNFAGGVVQTGQDPVDQVTTDNGRTLADAGGSTGALLDAYNTGIPQFGTQLDAVASALITNVNSIVSNCYDLNGNGGTSLFSGSNAASMAVAVTDPSALALSAASLQGTAINSTGNQVNSGASLSSQAGNLGTALSAASGSFSVNGQGINWNNSMTLSQILAQFPPGITASFNATTQQITLQRNPAADSSAQPGITIQDLSGNLGAALNLTTATLDKGIPGDATGANAILALGTNPVMGTPPDMSIPQGMQAMSTAIANSAQGWQSEATTATTVQSSMTAQRTSTSGVDSDEEATNLMQYESGYEAAVKLADAQDEILKTLITDLGSSTAV